jgi:hypothetical protein
VRRNGVFAPFDRLRAGCGSIAQEFLADPEAAPDGSCLEGLRPLFE